MLWPGVYLSSWQKYMQTISVIPTLTDSETRDSCWTFYYLCWAADNFQLLRFLSRLRPAMPDSGLKLWQESTPDAETSANAGAREAEWPDPLPFQLTFTSEWPCSDRAYPSDTSSINCYYHCHVFKCIIMLASKNEKPASVSTFVQSIDDPTIRMVMQYFKIEDYDCFVRFAQKSGLKISNKHNIPERPDPPT